MFLFDIFFVALLGLVFGSFVTLISYRLPREEPVVVARSCCPHCKNFLSARELVPFFSWVWQRGKCAHCAHGLSARYPLIEFSQMILFLESYRLFGLSLMMVIACALSVALLIMIVTDLEFQIIPDTIQIALFLIAIFYRYAAGLSMIEGIEAALLLCVGSFLLRAVFWRVRKREGLGLGDVKFFGAAGMFLGFIPIAPFLLYSGILGVVLSLLWKRLGRGDEFPFGPALAIALWICLFYPASVAVFYP